MNKTSTSSLLLVTLLLTGCQDFPIVTRPEKVQAQTPAVKVSRVPVHRFVMTKYNADVAFDTQTGQLCRTWAWQSIAKKTPEQELKGIPSAMGEYSPTCIDLYKQFPSGSATSSEALAEE
jgi:hypothetical protein